MVQQEEPSEALNEQHLGGVAHDDAVQETMDRHMIPVETDLSQNATTYNDDEDDRTFDDLKDESSEDNQGWSARAGSRSGKGDVASKRDSSC